MAIEKDDIIQLLKRKGPMVPAEIKSQLGGDTIITGAILSEQTAKGTIRISHLKKGSSPFYYLPGQEQQLERFSELLDPKDQETLAMLRERQVLQDASMELFYRVSLRRLKDFAKEFKANTIYGELLFWRYHLVSETRAIELLKQRYGRNEPKREQQAPQPAKTKEQSNTTNQQAERQIIDQNPITPYPDSQSLSSASSSPPSKTGSQNPESRLSSSVSAPASGSTTQKELSKQEFEMTLFFKKAAAYFKENNIHILSQEQVAKNREYDFIIRVHTDVGEMRMFARAKSKKRLNEGDVAPALLKAKTKELPCLFLTDGEFTKKSLKLMQHEYKGLIINTLS
ncbi:MAG: hypothetical protein ACOCU6_00375 [Nanoarchaeota archaeon]